MTDEEKLAELEDMICARVRDWINRSAALLNRTGPVEKTIDHAEITIHLSDPGWDDDDALILESRIDEKVHVADITGRVSSLARPAEPRR